MTSREIGNIGERAVCWYLRFRGYRILERNYLIKGGEIDIIAKKYGVIHFVEVKTRKENSLTTGGEAITNAKKMRIVKTAKLYLLRTSSDNQCQFDVAIVTHNNKKVTNIEFYSNAFDARYYHTL